MRARPHSEKRYSVLKRISGLIVALLLGVGLLVAPPASAAPTDYLQITLAGVHPVWDPCSTVTYYIAPGDAAGNTAQIDAAMNDVHYWSGYNVARTYEQSGASIQFRFDGSFNTGIYTDVNLRKYSYNPASVGYQYPGGTIVHLDPVNAIPALTRHEIGHAMGLAHFNSASQLMNPAVSVADYQDGDRAGLHQVFVEAVNANCQPQQGDWTDTEGRTFTQPPSEPHQPYCFRPPCR
jgi:hypothetical protein